MKLRLKRLIINPEAFLKIMSQDTAWRVKAGVPKTARLHGFLIDPSTQNLVIFLEDESFDPIDVTNEVAPLLVTEFRKIL